MGRNRTKIILLIAAIPLGVFLSLLWIGSWRDAAIAPNHPATFPAASVQAPEHSMAAPSLPPAEKTQPPAAHRADAAVSSTGRDEELRTWRDLARTNLEVALARAAALTLQEDRDAAVNQICLEVARRDPARALAVAWRMGLGKRDGPPDGGVLENLAEHCARTNLSTTLDWATQLPGEPRDDRRERLIAGLAEFWAKTAPQEAAGLIADELPEGAMQCQAATTVLREWARRDLSSATAWAKAAPSGALRDTALRTLAALTLKPPQASP